MSKFYVGQRVKKVRGNDPGMTGVVAEIDNTDSRSLGVRADHDGAGYDSLDCHELYRAGEVVFGYPADFEPLQPERNQTIAWSECVWKPEHMRAEA